MDPLALASRALLFPGPQPPLTHLGATMLRHVLGSGLRWAFYQLGLPMPEGPPVRISRLRLYLDARSIERLIGDVGGGAEVTRALLDPGGRAADRLPTGLAAAAVFHRARLRLARGASAKAPPFGGDASWTAFRATLSALLPGLNDALLAELLAVLARRSRRRRGHAAEPVASPAAARWLAGDRAEANGLGPPDLYRGSWAVDPGAAPPAADGAVDPAAAADPLRGRFRERYRLALDRLRPAYLRLAERAAGRGLLDRADDAFFLPFDLAADLELESAPAWLAAAVAANRAEYEGELERPSPPEILLPGEARGPVQLGEAGPDWQAAPLRLLA